MFDNLRLITRIILSPALAFAGLVLILLLTLTVGLQVSGLTKDIQEHFVPGVDQTQRLKAALLDLSRIFQDASSESDLELLDQADATRDEIVAILEAIEGNATAFPSGEVSDIRSVFDAYFELARPTTLQMIESGYSPELSARIQEITSGYNALSEQINRLSQNSQERLFERLTTLRDRQALVNAAVPIISASSSSCWRSSRASSSPR